MSPSRTSESRWAIDPALERRRAAWARAWRWLLADADEEERTASVAPATRPAQPPDTDGSA